MALPATQTTTTASAPSFGTWRSVFVLLDDGSHGPSQYGEVERRFRQHAELYGKRAGFLTVIPVGAKHPSRETQKVIAESFDRIAPMMDGLTWVVEGTGFHCAMVRATLTTISLAKRKPYPSRVASNVTEALGWLLSRRPAGAVGVNIDDGLAMVDGLRNPSSSSHSQIRLARPSLSADLTRGL